jgi:hypothetical protein
MNLIFPKNIYTILIADLLPDELRQNLKFMPAAVITQQLIADPDSAALIPSLDLINHKDLFISGEFGIAFEGILGNSWIYFNDKEQKINDLYLLGDISSTEVILSKILFKETYNTDVNIHLASDEKVLDKNILLIGDLNYKNELYSRGLSFTEEIIEIIPTPYVNFLYASGSESLLKELNAGLKGVSNKIYDRIEERQFGSELSDTAMDFISKNVSDLIFDFTEQDNDGINQLLRLPYFYGIAPEMLDVKFV